MSSKKRRCLLKTDFARVTKLRIMAALLVATVVIGMPFSVEAFVATSQTINDTYVIINEDLPTTNLPHQGFFTKTQYRKAFVSLLRNQATIVKKLNNLASEVSLIKNDLGLQKFQGSHDFKSRDMHHHKPFNENTKARKENKVMKHLDEINEKLMVLLYLQRERNLDNSDNHKSSNTPSSQTYSGHEPHSRTRRSSVYVPDTFAFSTPVFNTHIPSLNMDPGYIESNHIDPNPQNSYTGGYGASLPRVQPSVNSGSSFTSTYGDNSELNSVYDDPQPMYGPLYDRNSMLYKTAYPDTSLPGTSYQEPSLRFDSLFDSQQTSSFGSVVRDSSYYSPQLGQSSNSESEESSRNAAYLEAHSDDAQRLSHGMKSMLQELLSLVRWLVRKKHQTQSSQNSYITSIQHTLNQRLTSIEGSIIGAMTTQTQDILQSTHQIGHEIRLETADFNFHNLSQIILEAVSNITSEREVTSIEKCITNTANEIGAERPNDLDNAVNEFKEETLETANSRRTDDIQAATVASDKHTYHLSDINQENIEVSGLNSYDDISSNKNKKGPIWEVFSFSDFLSNPSDDSSLEPESSMRIQHLETSGTDNNATSTSIIDTTETVFDSINATDEERLRMSLKSINPRSATQAANILVLATELLKNASSTHQSSRQVESSPPCVPVNQTELVRSFTNEFQVFLEELKTKLGHSLSQNLAEDSLELVLSRLLGPSVQRLEERMLGVQIYLDAAVLKLRHESTIHVNYRNAFYGSLILVLYTTHSTALYAATFVGASSHTVNTASTTNVQSFVLTHVVLR
ncbi:hypothetical protein FHG87_019139 [Trinorchestia longiramus]|nr:hypothetical protein FHG87_019139 [Trinorchestia longiramus]